MPKCKSCLLEKPSTELVAGKCNTCRGVKSQPKKEIPHDLPYSELEKIVLTTETNSPFAVEKRIGIVTAECVIGLNLFKDFFSGISDIVGGRNKGFQIALKEAREIVLEELRKEAYLIDSNAVISVNLNYSEISGGGKSMLFVVATGTAVKAIEPK